MMVTCIRARGNSQGIVKRLRIETIDAAKTDYSPILMKEEGENMEKWKPLIIDNEISKYEISDFGRIKSFHNPKKVKILKSYETNSGYQTICLVHKKRKIWVLLHRIVAIHFIPLPKYLKEQGYTFDDLEVNHKDGCKNHNYVKNLEWNTSSENKYHAYKHGLKKEGEESPVSIYTEKQINLVCSLLSENKISTRDISFMTKVDYGTISSISTIGDGDNLVITDKDSKIIKSFIEFDATTTNTALTPSGS